MTSIIAPNELYRDVIFEDISEYSRDISIMNHYYIYKFDIENKNSHF